MQKISSILDYSYPSLDPAVFNKDLNLYEYQRDFILRLLDKMYETYNLKEPQKWVEDIVILGSLTTSKWLLTSDMDVHIRVNIEEFRKINMPEVSAEQAYEHLDLTRKEFDRAKILAPMTQHPIEVYFESLSTNPSNIALVGVYSLLQKTWLKAPVLFEADLDFEESKKDVIAQAEALAEELDGSLGKIQRDIQRVNELEEVIKAWGPDKQQLFYAKVEAKLKAIEAEILKDLQIKQELVDARHANQDAMSEIEVKFKWLARFGFFGILNNLKTLLEQTGGEVTTQELPLIEKIISQGSINKLSSDKKYWISPDGQIYPFEPHREHTQWMAKKFPDGPPGDRDWIRASTEGHYINVEVEDLHAIPSYVDDFIVSVGNGYPEILVASYRFMNGGDSSAIVPYEDAIENGIQKAVNKALAQKRMGSIKKKAEVVEIATTYSRGEFPVLIDPTEDEQQELIKKSEYTELRYLEGSNGNVYVWDAYRSTHAEVAKELHYRGFDVDENSIRGTISEDRGPTWPEEEEALGSIDKEAKVLRLEPYGGGTDIPILVNPTRNEMYGLLKRIKGNGGIRVVKGNNTYMWEGYLATHDHIIQQLVDLGYEEYSMVETGYLVSEAEIEEFLQGKAASIKEAFLKQAFEKQDICVDLDKTIAQDAEFPKIGDPVKGAKEALEKLQDLGYNVIIYSCRGDTEEGVDLVREYLDKHEIPYDSIFEGEKPFAKFYIDDHAIRFDNWDNVLEQVEKTEKKASLAIVAALGTKYWLDPSGKEFPVGTALGHYGWIRKNYALLEEVYGVKFLSPTSQLDEGDELIANGWTRITTESDYDFSMEVADINNLPPYLDNFIAQHYTGGGVDIDDLQGNYQDLSDPFPSLAKQINRAKRLRQQSIASSLNKKAYSSIGTNKYWITPQGKIIQIGQSEMHIDWVMHHLAQLAKLGVDVEDLSAPFAFYKKIYWDDLDGGEQTTFERIMNGMQLNGWVRITTDNVKTQFDVDGGKMGFGPGVDQFIAGHFDPNAGKPIGAYWKGGEYLEIDNPFPTLMQAYQKAAKGIRHASFSKRDIIAKTKKVKQGDYSCLMALVPHDLAQEIVEWGVRNVPDKDLYLDEEGKLGRELESHITIKYGLLTNDAKHVRRSFNDDKPFHAKLGKVRHFQPPELPFDVLTVEVISDDLQKANKKVCDSFECAEGLVSDEYKPHITIAYMKRDKAHEYVGFEGFDGKEVELDTIIFSPHKGNRTYFSISNDKESSFILQEINKTASGDNFLPSLFNAPNNEWQFQEGGPDQEIALNPDSVSDDTTEYEPCTTGKPRTKEVWRQFMSIFRNPISKTEDMTIKSDYDPEMDEKEKEEMGLDQTQLEYSKGFYDPKKHDFPHNTTWDSLTQDGEPSKPTSVTYSPQISNEDNLDQNSPGGYPRRFMGKPKGEWFSNEGEVNNALIDMLKNREAALDNMTIDITADYSNAYWIDPSGKIFQVRGSSVTTEDMNRDFNSHGDWISANIDMLVKDYGFKPAEKSTGLFNVPITVNDLINAGWIRVGDAFGTDWGITVKDLKNIPPSVDNLLAQFAPEGSIITVATEDAPGKAINFEWPVKSVQQTIMRDQQVRERVQNQPVMAKQAGDQSASVPDYLINEWKTEQINNDTDEEPYVNHDQRDTSYGFHDSPENTGTGIGWNKDNQPSVVHLDTLENPAYRLDPFGIGSYNVIWYSSLPLTDGLESTNPD